MKVFCLSCDNIKSTLLGKPGTVTATCTPIHSSKTKEKTGLNLLVRKGGKTTGGRLLATCIS